VDLDLAAREPGVARVVEEDQNFLFGREISALDEYRIFKLPDARNVKLDSVLG
jgi:hypothetical protein